MNVCHTRRCTVTTIPRLRLSRKWSGRSMQLARALKADVSIIARSGWGMYRDANGDTSGVLSSVYANTLGTQSTPAWSFSAQPDLPAHRFDQLRRVVSHSVFKHELNFLDILDIRGRVTLHYHDVGSLAWSQSPDLVKFP